MSQRANNRLVRPLIAGATFALFACEKQAPTEPRASSAMATVSTNTLPIVTTLAELASLDGRTAEVIGVYRAIPVPSKHPSRAEGGGPNEYATVVVDGGGEVFLEPYGTPAAHRRAEERDALDGKRVRVTGTVRRIMPATGQSLLAPCIEHITELHPIP